MDRFSSPFFHSRHLQSSLLTPTYDGARARDPLRAGDHEAADQDQEARAPVVHSAEQFFPILGIDIDKRRFPYDLKVHTSEEAILALKGLSHEIFRPVFWPVWIYLCLNGNRFWFLNFKEGCLILDNYFKF